MSDDLNAGPATIVFISREGIGCCGELKLADMFPEGSQVYERQLNRSAQKPELIEELVALIGDSISDAHEALGQKAALMLDEMLENALYAAPRNEQKQPLFSKGESRSLLPTERIRVRYRFDGARLALEVRDSWGTLTAAQLFECLATNVAETEPDADRAGRGLFFMWRLMDQLYVSIDPGRETTVGGYMRLQESPSVLEY